MNHSIQSARPLLGSIALLFLIFCVDLEAQTRSISGLGKNVVTRNYETNDSALLQSFYVGFTYKDRHIQAVGVLPNSPSPDKLTAFYYDDSRDDEYYYLVSHYTGIAVQPHVVSGYAAGNESRKLNKPGSNYEFVIIGFSFYFPGGDHHIDQIGVLENNGTVEIFFNDKNNDDLFSWELHYAWIPSYFIREKGRVLGTKARGATSRSVSWNGTPVIRGFKLNYEPYFTSGQDHHITEIGVLLRSWGVVEVYYSDQNQDDGFDWEVEWATL